MFLEIFIFAFLYVLSAILVGLPRAHLSWNLHDESKIDDRSKHYGFTRLMIFPWSTLLELACGLLDIGYDDRKKGLARFFHDEHLFLVVTSSNWAIKLACDAVGMSILSVGLMIGAIVDLLWDLGDALIDGIRRLTKKLKG